MTASTNHAISSAAKPAIRAIQSDTKAYADRVALLFDAVEAAHTFARGFEAAKYATLLDNLRNRDNYDATQFQEFQNVINNISATAASELASSMRASALILTHSHVDDGLNRMLGVLVTHDLPWWEKRILTGGAKAYTLQEALDLDRPAVKLLAAQAYLNKQSRSSIVDRNDLILCRIGHLGVSLTSKRLARSALSAFDRERHLLIHANQLVKESYTEAARTQCLDIFEHVNNLSGSLAEFFGIYSSFLDDAIAEAQRKISQK